MPSVNIVVETKIKETSRVKQLSAMFDIPFQETSKLKWDGDVPFEEKEWNVGLIVGPSGSGKTTIAKKLFGDFTHPKWNDESVIDNFAKEISIDDISKICQSVGFNTIPAWMRPYSVLSNGEKFRVDCARHILEDKGIVVIDEFTSVVDRQVAQIASHAIQKTVRRDATKKFVAVSCHYDVIDWLQPDWILEPATMGFSWRLLRRRPEIKISIQRVNYSAWHIFSKFHYLTAELNKNANCFVLFANGQPAAFAGIIYRPHPIAKDIYGVSRLVTLPDWQGIGLAMVLVDYLGSAYKALKLRLRMYPAHPSFIRTFDKSDKWTLKKKPGNFEQNTTRIRYIKAGMRPPDVNALGGRPCAVFEYCGDAIEKELATNLLNSKF